MFCSNAQFRKTLTSIFFCTYFSLVRVIRFVTKGSMISSDNQNPNPLYFKLTINCYKWPWLTVGEMPIDQGWQSRKGPFTTLYSIKTAWPSSQGSFFQTNGHRLGTAFFAVLFLLTQTFIFYYFTIRLPPHYPVHIKDRLTDQLGHFLSDKWTQVRHSALGHCMI